ncbi:LAQU0S12e01992g1_1 [Lachancea quebecensis]|uniref:LAQU0S12e01992g1_1 n=1 Tax=Lachancea quebecensis TaxID=1654605 RepID=A0A0P1KUN6_9SACH|nr:LAQU0S12e01992g1_1 [Lachancea quebecensis]
MTDAEASEDAESKHQIKHFLDAVVRHKSGNFPNLNKSNEGFIFPSTSGTSTNRGNKLLQSSEEVSRTSLNNLPGNDRDQVFYNGSVHKLLARSRISDGDNDSETLDLDLHKLVNVRNILAPVSTIEDVAKHPAISKTFKSEVLGALALQAVLMVEKEQSNVVWLSKLLESFLGDYPGPLYEDTLNLEEYDHNLKLRDDGDEDIASQARPQQTSEQAASTDEDPFFALPQLDPSNILPPVISQKGEDALQEVETARQLAQIALQRNQEFIRNLQKIRKCIAKAERIKQRILGWGKEYAGIPEDDVTVPSALHVVKRGLISATTNRTMTDGQNFEAEEDEI